MALVRDSGRQSARACALVALSHAARDRRLARAATADGDRRRARSPDPVVIDFAIAYVKRPVPEDDMMETDVRARSSASSPAPISSCATAPRPPPSSATSPARSPRALGDVRDVEPSFDGKKIVFAMREPLIEGADHEDQPTWNIWEYDAATQRCGA